MSAMAVRNALIQAINLRGPLSLAHYMRLCLTHPTEGYYSNRDPFGSKGDFITSPEISQMFGELTGINILSQWINIGQPKSFRIVEFGPGRGTMLDDLLRAAKAFPNFFKSLEEIMLVESSPKLQEIQEKKLGVYQKKLNWYNLAKELPRDGKPTFIIAHEFFDALPIHQFERTETGWRERLVTNDDNGQFKLVLGPPRSVFGRILENQARFQNLPTSSQIEVCPQAWDIAKELSSILLANSGGLLIMDYGPSTTIPINTFRGFKDHKQVSPFEVEPGSADLTADVDFKALSDIFSQHKLRVDGPVTQRHWLHEMGIGARATILYNNQRSETGRQRIASAYSRLVDPVGMGKTYKIMGVSNQKQPIVGFETTTT